MKILLTGGGTGGHFYPVIAVADELNKLASSNRLVKPELYYMSTDPYNTSVLFEHNITYVSVTAGKIRVGGGVSNIILNGIDMCKTLFGVLEAVWKMFFIYPDVVFGKGGYVSFPALCAARILRIPVVIHESDSVPGRVNLWAGRFAKRIALSYPEAAAYFDRAKTAHTGNPIRREIMDPQTMGAVELFGIDPSIKTILVLGGSQGSQRVNEAILDALPELLKDYQVIHQVGKKNSKVVNETKEVILLNHPHKKRYIPMDYLDVLHLRSAVGLADLIISRAGSTIFEIAIWKKPAIMIPITVSNGDHQRKNAYAYARTGAAAVLEEKNLTVHVLVSEVRRIIESQAEKERMSKAAESFARRDAATLIAEEVASIALSH